VSSRPVDNPTGPAPGRRHRRSPAAARAEPFAPPLPPGRIVTLPGRGRTFVRQLPGPPGAATVVLLHGWTANADLNWFTSYEALGRRYRVVALDHRGHGRGIRSRHPFRLRDCADDVAALVAELRCGPVVAVGYSMGGPVAQLLWRRHPEAVRGLVLCATARTFAGSAEERFGFLAMGGAALASRAVPTAARRLLARRFVGTRTDDGSVEAWVVGELHRNDWTKVLEAGNALGRFDSRPWIGEVDVPTAVVATMADGVVHPARQLALARSIPGATLHEVAGDHTACVTATRQFLPALLDACASVVDRSA
jgi:3-oxoadipate enol-lactonase